MHKAEPYATYQTRQAWGLTIGCPSLHEKALANSGMLLTTPLTRYSSGECGLVMAPARLLSGRSSPQSHCAKPIKKRCSGVKPPTGSSFFAAVALFHAL